MSQQSDSSQSTSTSRVRDYHTSEQNEVTWKHGYKPRFMKQSTGAYTAPEFAIVPKPRMSEAYLEVYRDESQILKSIHIYKHLNKSLMFVLGREPNAPECATEIVDNPSISRNHAAIVFTKEGLMIFDLFSRSGTMVNNQKITPGVGEPIFDRDVIQLGACSRQFRLKKSAYRRTEAEQHFLQLALKKQAAGKLEKRTTPTPDTTIKCSHILLKHTGSKNPNTSKGPVTRSLAEARQSLQEVLQKIRDNIATDSKIFETTAMEISECSSAKRGGDLGHFAHKAMQPAFSDAAFALEVGGISDLVESPSGVHIILRTA